MTEILDEQFGGSSLYSPINAINNINAGVLEIFAPKLASVGFDGNVPNIRGTKNASNLNMGDYILLQTSGNDLILGTDYADADSNVYLITKVFREIPSETEITIAIIYNQQERNIVLTNTDTAYYTEEDWANRALGSTNGGWMLTSAGNAIFNNVAVRGNITATGGSFTGNMTAGTMKIGADVNSTNDGIYIDANNFWYDTGRFRVSSTETSGVYTTNTTFKLTDGVSTAIGLESYHRQVQTGLDVIIGLNIQSDSSKTRMYTYYGPESGSYTLVGFNYAGNNIPIGIYQSTSESFSSPTTKFEVDRNGNTTIAGTLGVTGSTSLSGGGGLSGTFSGSPTFSGAPIFSGKVVFSNTTDVALSSGAYSIAIGDTAAAHIRLDPNEIQAMSVNSAANIYINKEGGGVFAPSVYSDVVSTRQVYVGSAGRLGTVSSTRRVKSLIETIDSSIADSNLFELDLVTFKYNFDIAEDGVENAKTQLGFIAEQAQELGLEFLYQVDEQGLPDYFAYDKLPLYMFAKMKKQEERIKLLEERLAILEG